MTKKDKSEFDEMVEGIQNEMDAEAEATFSKKVIEEFKNPQNVGRMSLPDAIGIITGPCGDTIEIYLKVKNKKITEIQFMTDGCGPTIACSSMITKLVKGKDIQAVQKLKETDLISALDGLPDENLHCAKLTIDTLKKSILNYKENNPEKF